MVSVAFAVRLALLAARPAGTTSASCGQGPVEELGVGSVTAARAREGEYHPLSHSALALFGARVVVECT